MVFYHVLVYHKLISSFNMENSSEIWKPTHKSDKYEISSLGRVRRADTGNIRKTRVFQDLNRVSFQDGGKTHTDFVGTIVLTVFDRPKKHGEKVQHIHDKLDDRLENLRWSTEPAGYDSRATGVRKKTTSRKVFILLGGERILCDSVTDASIRLNVHVDTVYRILNNGVSEYSINAVYADSPPLESSEIRTLGFTGNTVSVSSCGMVKSLHGGWKIGSLHGEYLRVKIPFDISGEPDSSGKGVGHYVHKLVALAFIGSPPSDCIKVDHINENKMDNRSINLQYLTNQENLKKTYTLGNTKPPGEKRVRMYTEEDENGVKKTRMEEYKSISDASRELGCSVATVSNYCNKKRVPKNGNVFFFSTDPEDPGNKN